MHIFYGGLTMSKPTGQKLRLLYLAKLLFQETDENHDLTLSEILSYLSDLQITVNRKTIYDDLEALRLFGFDILSEQRGHKTYYKMVSREFETAELKLLVDSVQSSKFITEKKSRSLIKKLESLVSRHDAVQLHKQVLITGRVKTLNESIYYNVDDLHSAINQNCQIQFQYFQWNLNKEPEFRHGGALYQVSPWYLRWDDENYYLIAYHKNDDSIRHYRVDKMKNITLTDLPREGEDRLNPAEITAYTKGLFGMYGGEETHITLEADNALIGVLIDRFGQDISIVKLDDEHFQAFVNVVVSPQFFSWIIGLGKGIKITAPDRVVQKMQKMIQDLSSLYLSKE